MAKGVDLSPDLCEDQFCRQLQRILRPVKRVPSPFVFLFFFILLTSAFIFRIDQRTLLIIEKARDLKHKTFTAKPLTKSVEHPLTCSNATVPDTSAANHPSTLRLDAGGPSAGSCPGYFRWIHEDLRPWKEAGITRETLEGAKKFAHFRLVILDGNAYVEIFRSAFQTRDQFTLWGFLQLLRLYPGKVPDLELMFSCEDMPLIKNRDARGSYATPSPPPVLFQYCGKDTQVGVVFPDWSFWGWAEVNIKPWRGMLEGIIEGNKRTKWKGRVPYAYWKGNSFLSSNRRDLMTCNISDRHDWNARIYYQSWRIERQEGFKNSHLEDQCTHRYKIYIEGIGWSVSDKYILACNSMNLFVKPEFYDFFMRSLMPMQHYWPIRPENMCKDIEFAVKWGDNNSEKAEAIGMAGSRFIQENLKMEFVYDYMFHLLTEYSKLLKFKPEIPEEGLKISAESMACPQDGLTKSFLLESMVKSPSDTLPCTMPPAYTSSELEAFFNRKREAAKRVEMWVDDYYNDTKVNSTSVM